MIEEINPYNRSWLFSESLSKKMPKLKYKNIQIIHDDQLLGYYQSLVDDFPFTSLCLDFIKFNSILDS